MASRARRHFPPKAPRRTLRSTQSEDDMKPALFAVALAAAHLTSFAAAGPARADWLDEVRATYLAFAAAQNARDLKTVRSLLLDSPRFLWVSDGRSVWGPDAT